MRLVVALGGNALLQRGEVPAAEIQRHHVEAGVAALTPLLAEHDVLVTHGNGPQVGLLALESASDPALDHPYPFDVLGAQTQGMIGYLVAQAIDNALPGRRVVGLLSQTLVAADDPAFSFPSKFVGPTYLDAEAKQLAARFGWRFAAEGDRWRRVVASPEPIGLVELPVVRSLLAEGVVVVCVGGGGVPVVRAPDGRLAGVEAVVDKDLSSSLVAVELGADALVLLTDVGAVELGFGTDPALALRPVSPDALRRERFAAGSMGPKVEASCRFVEATGNPAYIGSLAEAASLLSGATGTYVGPGVELVAERPGVGSADPGRSPGAGGPRTGAERNGRR